MAKVKTISMAEAVSKLEKNPAIQQALAEIKRKQKESPARHNRQFNLELMNISMELNGRCQIIGMLTNIVLDAEYSNEDRTEAYNRRSEEILIVAGLQQRHDKLVAELDQAIVDEDNAKSVA